MRQKCEYCHTNPEINEKGKCPNCGAEIPIIGFVNSQFSPYERLVDVRGYPRPSGSFANISPNWTIIGAHRPFDEINRFILGE